MIWAAFATAREFLRTIPWPVWAIAAVLLTGFLWGNHRYSEGVEDTEARYSAARAAAVAQARKADAAGVEAANAGKALSEAEIDRGRDAARESDDPWRSATEAMR